MTTETEPVFPRNECGDNLREVAEGLWIGASLDTFYRLEGFGLIIDVFGVSRAFDRRETALSNHVGRATILRMPFPDCEPVPDYAFEIAIAAVAALRNQTRIMIACHAGVSRSPTVTAVVLALVYGVPWEEAYQRVRGRGLMNRPHPVTLQSGREFVQRKLGVELPKIGETGYLEEWNKHS